MYKGSPSPERFHSPPPFICLRGWQTRAHGLPAYFANKVLLQHNHTSIRLCIVYGCFHTTTAMSSICNKGWKAPMKKIFTIWPFALKSCWHLISLRLLHLSKHSLNSPPPGSSPWPSQFSLRVLTSHNMMPLIIHELLLPYFPSFYVYFEKVSLSTMYSSCGQGPHFNLSVKLCSVVVSKVEVYVFWRVKSCSVPGQCHDLEQGTSPPWSSLPICNLVW